MDDLQQVKSYKYLNKFKHTHLANLNHEFHPLPDFLRLLFQACCSGNGGHCGDHSSSSSVLEMLQEDSHSGMGSAMSASTGSTSNDCNTSNSGTGHCKLMLHININTLIQKNTKHMQSVITLRKQLLTPDYWIESGQSGPLFFCCYLSSHFNP